MFKNQVCHSHISRPDYAPYAPRVYLRGWLNKRKEWAVGEGEVAGLKKVSGHRRIIMADLVSGDRVISTADLNILFNITLIPLIPNPDNYNTKIKNFTKAHEYRLRNHQQKY